MKNPKFKAAMFDFDGTVTEKGSVAPSEEMAKVLFKLACQIPVAFCTGRQKSSFEEHGLKIILSNLEVSTRQKFLKNLYLIAENGSIGYAFDTEIDEYKEFYRVLWPEKFVERKWLMDKLAELTEGFGKVHYDKHEVVVVIGSRGHDEDIDIKDVYEISNRIYDIVIKLFKEVSPNYEDFVNIGNSGIGVVIVPKNGDKDYGIFKFGELLKEKREMSFDAKLSEILVVGDNPQVGGNDHEFLKGTYGTPYNVGEHTLDEKLPLNVYDDNGQKLLHAPGTIHLIRKFLNSLD
ncbi:MAG: hypothetical protein Q8P72_06220 [Candidatus Roizmanbacteria bacterium]|nr:hypothetical protein [Candidatus Roizmanbacteria bacterium]